MTYLTEARISFQESIRRRNGLPKGLVDSYAWHQAVWEMFPGKEKNSRDFLFRIDPVDEGYRLIILSKTVPFIPAWLELGKWKTTEIAPKYFTHSRYAFQLRANATKTCSQSRVRSGILCPNELVQWIDRKGTTGGFSIEVESLQVIPKGMASFVRDGNKGFHRVTEFKGILQVTDSERFYQSVIQGIGRARAFGCGMMMIVPIF